MNHVDIPLDTIIKTLRRKVNSSKKDCFICNKHKLITHIHHIIPVHEYAKVIAKYHIKGKIPNPLIHLCPNHHAYIHELKRGNIDILLQLTKDEILQIELLNKIEQTAVSDFFNIVNGENNELPPSS